LTAATGPATLPPGEIGLRDHAPRRPETEMAQISKNKPPKKVLKALFFDLPAKHDPLNKSGKAPLEISYSFETSDIASLKLGYGGYSAFSSSQKDAVRSVLAEYATFINVRFVEGGPGDTDLYFGRANLKAMDGLGGFSWRKTSKSFDLDGYALFDNGQSLTDLYGRHLIVHEIGHAMTLKHPGRYSAGDEKPFLPKAKDNNKFTAMSYRKNPDSGELADRLMLYDIAALQARYGANLDHRTGNDVYGPPTARLEVIWDAGGTDRIDGSSLSSNLKIDLRDGKFSNLGQKANLAVAFGTIIENATGGSGNDKLVGNKRANILDGGPGNDALIGGKGADLLIGGPGSDRFVFKAKPKTGVDTIADFDPIFDVIHLAKKSFAGIGGKGVLKAGKFHIGDEAADRKDRIIYDDVARLLIHDKNGSAGGKAKVFAKVEAGLDLDHGVFIVI
jgi:serralysin